MYPLVTIAVPTLNSSSYLRETLQYVQAQDYPNLDILVSDNGSGDATAALVERLAKADPRVRLRRNPATVPMHAHFTQCVEAARGEYFILLCDDDRINERFVSALVAVATKFPDANVVVPANRTIDDKGAILEEAGTSHPEVFDGPEYVCRWLYGRGPRLFINNVTVLARTSIVQRFGGYQALPGARNDDNLLFMQCAITGRVGFAKDAVFDWRIHNTSHTSRVTPLQIAECSRALVEHLQEEPQTVAALKQLSSERRSQIIAGVQYMTALELVAHIQFLHRSVLREIISPAILKHRWDTMLMRAVARHYYMQLRRLVRTTVLQGAR